MYAPMTFKIVVLNFVLIYLPKVGTYHATLPMVDTYLGTFYVSIVERSTLVQRQGRWMLNKLDLMPLFQH